MNQSKGINSFVNNFYKCMRQFSCGSDIFVLMINRVIIETYFPKIKVMTPEMFRKCSEKCQKYAQDIEKSEI